MSFPGCRYNTKQDYVHRVGRTGRAGNSGTAYTFISRDGEDKYAHVVAKALRLSGKPVPTELQDLSDNYWKRCESGEAHKSGNGYTFGCRGYRHTKEEKKKRRVATGNFGIDDGEINSEENEDFQGCSDEDETDDHDDMKEKTQNFNTNDSDYQNEGNNSNSHIQKKNINDKNIGHNIDDTNSVGTTMKNVRNFVKSLEISHSQLRGPPDHLQLQRRECYQSEVEINDYAQRTRWRLTHKSALDSLMIGTNTQISLRGNFSPRDRQPQPGQRKLYLLIEGKEADVMNTRLEIIRIASEEETTAGRTHTMFSV